MSASGVALARSWRVGRYTATLSVPKAKPGTAAACVVEWSPEVPQRLTPAEWRQYRAGRDRAIAELGLSALVLEA